MDALFIVLKVFGCVFLIWKAWGLWNAASAVGNASASGFLGNLATSFTVAISNPQALLFYVAVVPQVTQTTNPFALSAIIGVGFPFISVLYIALASPIRAWIHRGKNGKLLNRVIAVIFAALAAVVALR